MRDDPTQDAGDAVACAIAENGGPPEAHGHTFIYFVQAEHGGPIKIGRSDTPRTRLAALRAASPYPLLMTHAAISDASEELRLHALFAEFRLHGEWFKAHPVLAHIARAIPDDSLTDVAIVNKPLPSTYERHMGQRRRLDEYSYELALDARLARERRNGAQAIPQPQPHPRPITYRPDYPLDQLGNEVEPRDREFLGF